jgi:hypothetical protein
MSDTTDTTEDTENQSSGKNWRRDLEERATKAEERAAQFEQQLTGIHRTTALKEAGLDLSLNEEGKPNNPLHKFFADKYDGELNAEAIKAEATSTRILSAQTPQDPAVANTAGQHAFMDQASYGADAPPSLGSQQAVMEELEQAKSKGQAEFKAVLAKHRMLDR